LTRAATTEGVLNVAEYVAARPVAPARGDTFRRIQLISYFYRTKYTRDEAYDIVYRANDAIRAPPCARHFKDGSLFLTKTAQETVRTWH